MTPQIRDFDPTWNYPYDVRLTPAPVPESGIFDAPQIKVCINGAWATHVDGVLGRLIEPDAWTGTDEETMFAVQQIRELLAVLSQVSEGCDAMPITNIRINSCNLEIQVDGVDDWIVVGDISECATGETGPAGPPGADGADGVDGAPGADGASPEMRVFEEVIQWRQDDDDPTWTDLIELEELEGPQGNPGPTGATGPTGPQGEPGEPGEDCDCVTPGPAYVPPEETLDIQCSIAINEAKYVRGLWDKAYEDDGGNISDYINLLITGSALLAIFFPVAGIGALIGSIMVGILVSINDQETNQFDNEYEEKLRCWLYCLLIDQGKTTIDQAIIDAWVALIETGSNPYEALAAQLIQNTPISEFQWIAYASSEVDPAACDCDCDDDEPEVCATYDFRVDDGGFLPVSGSCITWVSGDGWRRPASGCTPTTIFKAVNAVVTAVEWEITPAESLAAMSALDGLTTIVTSYGGPVTPTNGGAGRRRYEFPEPTFVTQLNFALRSTSSVTRYNHEVVIECAT
jgi:hypothetical protein